MISTDILKQEYGTEMAAIILCCRVHFKTATIADLQSFIDSSKIDIDLFRRLAAIHRIRPVVYKVMSNNNIALDAKNAIQLEYTEIIVKNWKNVIETERIIMLLGQFGIEAIPYKGPAFSKQFFGDLISRESSDIDLIITQNDLPRSVAILKKENYLPELEDIHTYLGDKYYSYYKDYPLNKFNGSQREFHIELHWQIADKYWGLDHNKNSFIKQVTYPDKLLNNEIATLSYEDHFFAILIHHTIADNFKFLKSVVDLTQAFQVAHIRSRKDLIYQDMVTHHLEKALMISNSLSDQLFGVELMDQDENVSKIDEYFVKKLCLKVSNIEPKHQFFSHIKGVLYLQDSVKDKIAFGWRFLRDRFEPRQIDFRAFNLPRQFFFLYYLLRPFRSLFSPMTVINEKKKVALKAIATNAAQQAS